MTRNAKPAQDRTGFDVSGLDNAGLLQLRAAVANELKRRRLAGNVGQVAEILAVRYFNNTAGLPTLQIAPPNTRNVDALSRRGERYSIKGILDARKTGTIYPDREDPDKQLFEYLLIVKINDAWKLEAIWQFDWPTFCAFRSWDRHMGAWYIGMAARTLAQATKYSIEPDGLP